MRNKKLKLDDVIKVLKLHKEELQKFSVLRMGIFGSYVKGEQKKNSDIDFVVEFENPSLDNYMNLVDYLEKLFKRRVDILTPIGVETIRVKKVADEIKRSLIYV